MSGRRGRGGGIASGGRGTRLVVIGSGRGGAGAGRGAGGPPKTLNERFQALSSPQAKRKAQANQRVADSRFAKVMSKRTGAAPQSRAPVPVKGGGRGAKAGRGAGVKPGRGVQIGGMKKPVARVAAKAGGRGAGAGGRGAGGRGAGGAAGAGRGKGKKVEKKSQEELDADLDSYMALAPPEAAAAPAAPTA